MDGFIKSAHHGRKLACAANVDAPGLLATRQDRAAAVMGYHDAREIPNYWAWARAFVLQDHLFESDTLVEPARAPLHGLRVVGALLEEGRSDELPCRGPGAGLAAGRAAEPDRGDPRLRLDGPHLPPAQGPRELGLLRLQRHAAGLRRQRDVLQARPAEREDARDLEPAAVVRHGAAGPPARRHPAVPRLPRRRRRRGRCRRSRGSRRRRR